ncbi:MAG: peptidylprolyl isomerase [Alphaproteobacteria bacterium]|nr:MAG: peptidylprolyl isomerase [Alphaproteobacteria bacterium]
MRKFIYACMMTVLLMGMGLSSAMADSLRVIMKTSAGDVTFELYPEAAPITVENFLKYVDGKHYDGGSFYRVVRMDNQAQNKIKIEVIQGGMGADVTEFPFAPITHETTNDTGILHKDGVLSMARFEPGSATSDFFICVNDQPHLDFGGERNPDGQGFATFGKVIAGMDVVRAIQKMKTVMPEGNKLEFTSGQMLTEPVVIHHVQRLPVRP